MEPPQHYHHQHQADQENGNNKSGSGGYTCRQTSTRWTPTTEQIRVLKDLYYNKGVRSPTADQIQKISTTLKQYGKIEGKNVFYWFQNHKARERQKMRFNGTPMATTPTSSSPNSVMMASDHYHHPLLHHHHHRHGVSIQRPASVKLDQENHLLHQNRSYSSFNNGNSNHASSGTECGSANASNGYMSSHVYGSMEQEFPVSYNNVGGGWTNNMDHTHHYSAPAYNFFDRPKPLFGLDGYQEEGYGGGGDAYLEHRRTLPLFPMRGEDHINGGGGAIWKHDQSDGRDTYDRDPCASLKLCLNSYAGVGPN